MPKRIPQQHTPPCGSGKKVHAAKPNAWFWCLHCSRFFQAKGLRPDEVGRESCAFEDCDGSGFNIDIYGWDDWGHRSKNWPWWPASVADLKHGLVAGLHSADGK
jgi:hypothetical protein